MLKKNPRLDPDISRQKLARIKRERSQDVEISCPVPIREVWEGDVPVAFEACGGKAVKRYPSSLFVCQKCGKSYDQAHADMMTYQGRKTGEIIRKVEERKERKEEKERAERESRIAERESRIAERGAWNWHRLNLLRYHEE